MKHAEYSHVIYLGPGMRARDVMVEVNIRESQRINYLSAFFEDTNGHIKSGEFHANKEALCSLFIEK